MNARVSLAIDAFRQHQQALSLAAERQKELDLRVVAIAIQGDDGDLDEYFRLTEEILVERSVP
jgi:hypothetical protein